MTARAAGLPCVSRSATCPWVGCIRRGRARWTLRPLRVPMEAARADGDCAALRCANECYGLRRVPCACSVGSRYTSVTSFITVALTYFQLAIEDHRALSAVDPSVSSPFRAVAATVHFGRPQLPSSAAVLSCSEPGWRGSYSREGLTAVSQASPRKRRSIASLVHAVRTGVQGARWAVASRHCRVVVALVLFGRLHRVFRVCVLLLLLL